MEQEAPLGKGMTIEWGGEFENKERAMARLATVVPVALLITLVLLFKAFDSLSLRGDHPAQRALRAHGRRVRALG